MKIALPALSRTSLLALLILPGAVQAQTVINGVTITKSAPAPSQSARRSVPAFVDESVPADWIDIRGRISAAAGRVNLPAGSTVTVRLLEVSRQDVAARTLVDASFNSSRLPVSYQLVSSPRHFTSTGIYSVAVRVTDASGKLLYTSTTQQRINPAAKRILADIPVSATP